jgi:hypothetical protein
MKIGRLFAIFSYILIFSMLFSAAGITASEAKPEMAPEGAPNTVLTFEGLNRYQADPALTTDSWVSDTSGDIGMTRYIQAVNTSVAMYTKTGTLIIQSTFEDFWSTAATDTACDGNAEVPTHHGQPNVIYDHMAQRWLIQDLAYEDVDEGPYYLCIAVSNYTVGEEPLDFTDAGWMYYALPAQNQWPYYLPDQARIGLWPDGYYIAADLYDIDNNGLTRTAEGAKVWAVNRDDLVNGIFPFRSKSFYMTEEDYTYHGLLPSNLEGDPPPTGTPNFFVAIAPPDQFQIWEFSVDWTNPDASTFPFTPTVLHTATPFDWVVGYLVDQPGTNEMLDLHSERLSSVTYRIVDGVESLWASHTVMRDTGDDDIRWYELRSLTTTPYFYQQGSFAPDSSFRWVSSLGVDGAGNMAIGYSISDAVLYPSVFYTGRLKGDTLGTLPQGEQALIYGTGYQDMNPVTDEGPWGERSAMSVDPVDPCVFWYTNQFYLADDINIIEDGPTIWHTIIGAFRYPNCMQGMTTRVSLHTDGTQGNGASGIDFEGYSVDISDNGRYVAFASEATNLVYGDTNGRRDIFLRDRDVDGDGVYDEPGSVRTTRISMGLLGAQSNSDSWQVGISGDGRYVAFASFASNLVTGDTNGTSDVFRYDQMTGAIVRVSVSTAGVQGNALSDQPSVSYDGRYVAFRSYANNLIDGDANDPSDIFVRDVSSSVTSVVSINAAGELGDADSFDPSISGDGAVVAFASRATNLLLPTADGNADIADVFAYNRWSGTIELVSAVDATTTTFGDDESYTPSVSYNGSLIAFVSKATNLDPTYIDTNLSADVFVRKTLYDATVMISVSYFGGLANDDSYTPDISSEGGFIAYASDASTLDLYGDMNGRRDIFLYEMGTGLTRLISKANNGSSSNDRSVAPEISAQGSHVAYPSRATNLVTNDTNNEWDVFAYNRHGIIPTFLTIPSNVPAYAGDPVSIPVLYTSHGQSVDSTTFSVDFDEDCLTYNSTTFTLPWTSVGSASYNASDIDGELDIAIRAVTSPSVPLLDGNLAIINFTVKSSCQAASADGTRSAHVSFSTDPRASFGMNGQSIPGTTADGSVIVLGGYLGDCNNDGAVNAGDLTALVLEIFDGDGNVPANVPLGTFTGNPLGCNPNQDLVVDAGDISCEVMLIFDPNTACATSLGSTSEDFLFNVTSDLADASIDIAAEVPGPAWSQVTLPITLTTNGNPLNSAIFSIDYDRTWLSFDPNDPQAFSFNLPEGFEAEVSLGAAGQLNFAIFTLDPDLTLPDGVIANITLRVGQPDQAGLSPVYFFYDPPVSLGSTAGESVPVVRADGSVWVYSLMRHFFLPFTVVAP